MSWPAACAQCTIAQIMLCVVGLKCIIVVRVYETVISIIYNSIVVYFVRFRLVHFHEPRRAGKGLFESGGLPFW